MEESHVMDYVVRVNKPNMEEPHVMDYVVRVNKPNMEESHVMDYVVRGQQTQHGRVSCDGLCSEGSTNPTWKSLM